MYKLSNNKNYDAYDGFSLVELLIALGIFMIIATTLIIFSIDTSTAIRNSWDRIDGTLFLQKITNLIDIKKSERWSNISTLSNSGYKYIDLTTEEFNVLDGTGHYSVYDYYFTVTDVYRDINGNIVDTGGTLDPHTKRINYTVTWVGYRDKVFTVTDTKYLNDWTSFEWKQTTEADFNQGSFNMTEILADGDGAVRMERIIYADWCNPTLTMSYYDMPGQGVAKSIYGIPGDLSMGTGGNASGYAYLNVLISTAFPPVLTEQEVFNGYKTNDVFADAEYAYLATDSNQKEMVILDRNTVPISEVGYFDIPGSDDGNNLFIASNRGYVLGKNALFIVDLTVKTGSRPQVGSSISIPGTPKKVIIKGTYAYVLTSNNTNQLMVIDLNTNSTVGTATIDNRYVTDMDINAGATRAYIVTSNSSSYNEFYIVDISTKAGARPTINKWELGGTNATGVTIIEGANRAIAVGTGGTQQYQVFNIANEYSTVKCGGLTISEGINDIESLTDVSGNSYSYIVTGHSSRELQIIRGGPGGGDGTGYGYAPTADYTSTIFDSQSIVSTFTMLDVITQQPSGSNLKFQVRTSDLPDMAGATWFGPDGTSATYFNGTNSYAIPILDYSTRYFQYKAFFESDTAHTAILNETMVGYEK